MQGLEVLNAFYNAIKNHRSEDWALKKEEAYQYNKWFVHENTDQMLDNWVTALSPENVVKWVAKYQGIPEKAWAKKLGIIMAGNIPLVGMHDLLCGLVAGYKVIAKTSSDDEVLPKFWVKRATEMMPELHGRILFSERLGELDAAIATGSNNSSRYFEYYFRHMPHLLRKNRNSAAVLTGNETSEELVALGHDVFDYFGLGCRNVTHLLLPVGYEFKPLFDAWEAFAQMINHNKYVNNYHYHRALLLMNLDPHLDTGFVLLKERNELYSPVGMVNYSFYEDVDQAKKWLEERENALQCVVSHSAEFSLLRPGEAQKTMLWDYADGVDTLEWLLKSS